MTSTSISVSLVTEADRGRRSSRANSPKWLPGPRVATFRPFRVTLAWPSTMMKNSCPIRPSSTRTLPAGTSTESSDDRILRSSEPLQPEKSQMLLRSVAFAAFAMPRG